MFLQLNNIATYHNTPCRELFEASYIFMLMERHFIHESLSYHFLVNSGCLHKAVPVNVSGSTEIQHNSNWIQNQSNFDLKLCGKMEILSGFVSYLCRKVNDWCGAYVCSLTY